MIDWFAIGVKIATNQVRELYAKDAPVPEQWFNGDGVKSILHTDYHCGEGVAASNERLFTVKVIDDMTIQLEPVPAYNEFVHIWYTLATK